jgi:Lrp/AsnC family leucine-responsive transcriptional regulator
MDEIDSAILNELKQNGRASASEISKRVSLSVPAVGERIHKMEQAGTIQKYTVRLNRQQLGQHLLAFIFVNIDKNENIEPFREAIVQFSCVLECHHVAGEYDYLLKVAAADTQALEVFLSQSLKKISGVVRSNTIITLITLKEEIN